MVLDWSSLLVKDKEDYCRREMKNVCLGVKDYNLFYEYFKAVI